MAVNLVRFQGLTHLVLVFWVSTQIFGHLTREDLMSEVADIEERV
jgi:hypothetical protein